MRHSPLTDDDIFNQSRQNICLATIMQGGYFFDPTQMSHPEEYRCFVLPSYSFFNNFLLR